MDLTAYFWNAKYKNNQIGWDLGEISPPLKTYFEQLTNKNIKILIPGGGNSYEAEWLFKNGFYNVYVVDLSEIALKNIQQRIPHFPTSQLIQGNFFDIDDSFDLIVEQTFFCAIHPNLRANYAKKMHELLKPNGKLVGLLFDAKLNENHPPFGGNKKEYKAYFEPYFTVEIMENAFNSIASRAGMELFCIFKNTTSNT